MACKKFTFWLLRPIYHHDSPTGKQEGSLRPIILLFLSISFWTLLLLIKKRVKTRRNYVNKIFFGELVSERSDIMEISRQRWSSSMEEEVRCVLVKRRHDLICASQRSSSNFLWESLFVIVEAFVKVNSNDVLQRLSSDAVSWRKSFSDKETPRRFNLLASCREVHQTFWCTASNWLYHKEDALDAIIIIMRMHLIQLLII